LPADPLGGNAQLRAHPAARQIIAIFKPLKFGEIHTAGNSIAPQFSQESL
jgi:hypothetical protein